MNQYLQTCISGGWVFVLLATILSGPSVSAGIPVVEALIKNECRIRLTIPIEGVVHVTVHAPGDCDRTRISAVLPDLPAPADVRVTGRDGGRDIGDGTVSAALDDDGRIVFKTAAGRALLTATEVVFGAAPDLPGIRRVKARWSSAAPDALYGLGQYQDGQFDMRGLTRDCRQLNESDCLPVWVSSAGWGVLWDNPAPFSFQAERGPGMLLDAPHGGMADYYFMYGPRLDQVIARYRTLTGRAPLPPKWTLGYQQSREHYKSRKELEETVDRLRALQFPVDAIIQDWRYWKPGEWNGMLFDADRFPDPAGMIGRLHNRHVRFMISVWPGFGRDGTPPPVYADLEQGHYLSAPRTMGNMKYYNAFSARARSLVWGHANSNFLAKGVDGWWLDCSEPKLEGDRKTPGADLDQTEYGPWQTVANAYPFFVAAAFHDGQAAASSDKRVYILTRSAYAGIQRFGASVWTGDINSRWDVFRNQVAAGLGYVLSGAPYWNTDIGGFFCKYPGGAANPKFRELFVRWFQFGAFCPEFRAHGTGTPREPWQFGRPGEVTYDTLLRFATLRYRMMPYLYSLAWSVTDRHDTMLRPLPMDFPSDPLCRTLNSEYLFGPAVLVAPVTAPASPDGPPGRPVTRDVYLPAGADWYDFWSGGRYGGGTRLAMSVPLERMPLFLRGGSILALGPSMQWVDEKPADPLELRIIPGANAHFVLYQDAGDGYGYRRDERATIDIDWLDRTRTLTMGNRVGTYPGMPGRFQVHAVVVRPGHGTGVEAEKKPDAVFIYEGAAISKVLPASPQPDPLSRELKP